MKISELGGEAALINLIRDKYGATSAGDLALGIGDDCALIRMGESFLAVTADLLVEGTHFRMDINEPYLLGWKSAAVNISDIAAMGGSPTYSFISVGFPDIEVSIVDAIYEGMRDVSAKYGSVIAGGDTVASPSGIVINVTQLGMVDPARVARRDGAKPGDAILVTNTIGDSRAGLELLLRFGPHPTHLQKGEGVRCAHSRRHDHPAKGEEACILRHLKPEPRVNEARAAVATGKVNSMMDLSDGLAADLKKLCESSRAGAKVMANALPISDDLRIAARRLDIDPVRLSAGGGEDYELLLTCARSDTREIMDAISSTGSTASVIGTITGDTNVTLVFPNGEEEPISGSWEHF